MGVRKLRESETEVSWTGEQLAQLIFQDLELTIKKKKSWWSGLNPHKNGVVYFSENMLKRKTLGNAAELIHRCGLVLLESVHEKSVSKYYKTVRFVSIVPVFLIVAAVLAKLAGRLSFNVCFTVAVWGVALACLACLFNIITSREAVKRALYELEKRGGFKRLSEQEKVEGAAYGFVFLKSVPPLLAPFVK